MLDKLTGVSPSPIKSDPLMKNQKSEKMERLEDLGNSKLGSKNLKSDFNEKLKAQIKKDDLKKSDPKKELQAEKKESQPRENKKKVAKSSNNTNEREIKEKEKEPEQKNDAKMISNSMVSIENEVEIPEDLDSLNRGEQNLAMIEVSKLNSDINPENTFVDFKNNEQLQQQLQYPMEVNSSEAVVDQATVAAQVAEQSATQSAAPSVFQDKVMEALKNEQLSEQMPVQQDFKKLKLEQLKEKLALGLEAQSDISAPTDSKVALKAGMANTDAQNSSSDSKEDSSTKDTKSLKEDLVKNELMKSDSHHVGQADNFKTHLSANSLERAQASDPSAKLDSANDPSVNELMNQANYLVTKGGGEVTLKMNSTDGMGEVHLKVMMDNGKMNIELNTEDKSVKKLIEDSLSDLRSSLAARQISLEHVKINSVNATNTENSSQSLNNQNGQQHSNENKSFAQMQEQMSSQMQQHSQRQQERHAEKSFSQNFLNIERPVVLPMLNVQKSAASQYYGINKGSSLNAVA